MLISRLSKRYNVFIFLAVAKDPLHSKDQEQVHDAIAEHKREHTSSESSEVNTVAQPAGHNSQHNPQHYAPHESNHMQREAMRKTPEDTVGCLEFLILVYNVVF